VLRLEGVRIRQGDFALSADIVVEPGSRVALIGPSGSGKSTLLAAIAGFVPLSAGRVTWKGEDLAGLKPAQRPVTILFQDQNVFPHLSVRQNVALGLSPSLKLAPGDWARVDAALAELGLGAMAGRRPGTLSGGEQARVALARALIRARPLLLLDEPFAALGPALKEQALGLVEQIADQTGATVLMVSHDPDDARDLCPMAIPVAGGRAAGPVPTAALLDDPPPELASYFRSRK
jgi:thiamine transport system ATP-binding protein